MPKITVVLPVYNGEKYLKDSIESILSQTLQDFELIIVDDCSTDNTSHIAKRYAESHPKVLYHRNASNLKLPEALNKGFSLASGEYWTWTSCDNLYLPEAFERLVKGIEENPEVGLIYASMHIIDEMGATTSYLEAGPADDLILRNVVGACFLYKASIAKQVGCYNKELFLCEDYEYWLRVARVTQVKPLKMCLYKYRRHSDSLSHKHEQEIISKGIQIQRNYFRYFIDTRNKAARFYAYLRARDIYNPFRQLYLIRVLFYSPRVFFKELVQLVMRRLDKR